MVIVVFCVEITVRVKKNSFKIGFCCLAGLLIIKQTEIESSWYWPDSISSFRYTQISFAIQFFGTKNSANDLEEKITWRILIIVFSKSLPGLTVMVKHDDHVMTWYDHGDSYSPWYDHGMAVMKIAWSCHCDHGCFYNVVMTLIIQATLWNSAQVVVRYFLLWNILDEPIKNYPKDLL